MIKYFKDVPEPEFQGSVILEQYQANVSIVDLSNMPVDILLASAV